MEFNKGTLCNSWVMNPKEIYAMWKIYLRGSNEGVAIQTTVGRLRGALSIGSENFTLAKVSYEILSWFDTWYKTLPSYKSKPYSYECELRILIFDKFEEESIPIDVFPKLPLYEHGNSYPVDIHNLIDFIYISPFTSQWFHNVIKSTMQFFLPSFDNSKIIFSGIRDK